MASELDLRKCFEINRKFRPKYCQNLNDSAKVKDCHCLGVDCQQQTQNSRIPAN